MHLAWSVAFSMIVVAVLILSAVTLVVLAVTVSRRELGSMGPGSAAAGCRATSEDGPRGDRTHNPRIKSPLSDGSPDGMG